MIDRMNIERKEIPDDSGFTKIKNIIKIIDEHDNNFSCSYSSLIASISIKLHDIIYGTEFKREDIQFQNVSHLQSNFFWILQLHQNLGKRSDEIIQLIESSEGISIDEGLDSRLKRLNNISDIYMDFILKDDEFLNDHVSFNKYVNCIIIETSNFINHYLRLIRQEI